MRISPAGLRSGLPTTRFAAQISSSREPQLGLRRRLAPQVTAHQPDTARAPLLAALRSASRAVQAPTRAVDAPLSRRLVLRRSDSVSWSRPTIGRTHRPRPRSAAPWRG
jgi:hypothetical protein